MKTTSFSAGGFYLIGSCRLEQSHCIKVYPLVVLVLDVVEYRMFINANCWNKIATCPKISSRELLCFLFEPTCWFWLQNLNSISHRVLRWNDNVEMNVIISNMPCDNCKSFPLADKLEYPLQFLFDIIVSKNLSSLPRDPYHMVLAEVCGMFEFVEFG